jgi:hypothetical protein
MRGVVELGAFVREATTPANANRKLRQFLWYFAAASAFGRRISSTRRNADFMMSAPCAPSAGGRGRRRKTPIAAHRTLLVGRIKP